MSAFRYAFQTATNASKMGARRLHASARALEYYPGVDAKVSREGYMCLLLMLIDIMVSCQTFAKQVENGSGIVLVDFYAT
jgi:hypothetical protein